jgi:hypothetical protein
MMKHAMAYQLQLFELPTDEIDAASRKTRDALNIFYSKECNFCIKKPHKDGGWQFPDRTWWPICSNWAAYCRRIEGPEARLYGFRIEQNPLSRIAVECGGHDFAVLGGRFIVDGWVANVRGYSRRAVFDLFDRSDRKIIRELYGDPAVWLKRFRNKRLERRVDREDADERNEALAGVAPKKQHYSAVRSRTLRTSSGGDE